MARRWLFLVGFGAASTLLCLLYLRLPFNGSKSIFYHPGVPGDTFGDHPWEDRPLGGSEPTERPKDNGPGDPEDDFNLERIGQTVDSDLGGIQNNGMTFPRHPLRLKAPGQLRETHLDRLEYAMQQTIPDHRESNAQQLAALLSYVRDTPEDGYVPPKVLLTSYGYAACGLDKKCTSTTGEVIWLKPLIDIIENDINVFIIYVEYKDLYTAYRHLGDIVTHIWATDWHVVWCINDTVSCAESPENPEGIPPWKLFTFTFRGSPRHWGNFFAPDEPWSFNPLGGEWNLVPYKMPDRHFYLGYTYAGCTAMEEIPFAERNDQIVILAKRSEYFYVFNMYEPIFWNELLNSTSMELVTLANEEEGYPIPNGLKSMGVLSKVDYDRLLGSAKALFGIGRPILSPSPYASLCRGVPVIVPYRGKRCPAQTDTDWCAFLDNHQHGPAALIGPPYVYAVDVDGPIEDILKIVETAVTTPIAPYEVPEMTREALVQRTTDYFSIDWNAYAASRMKEMGWEHVRTQEWMRKWLENNSDPGKKDRMEYLRVHPY